MTPLNISVSFMAASLMQCFIKGEWPAVCAFIASSLLFGFVCYLDRSKVDKIADLEKKVQNVSDQMTAIHINMGWK